MVELPSEYASQYIQQYVGYPKVKKNGIINGGCPICREGTSWGKSSRFYYNPEIDVCHCFNCGYAHKSVNFIIDMTGMTFGEIMEESKDYDIIPRDININYSDKNDKSDFDFPLPLNSIDLNDETQLEYYKDNEVVNLALDYIESRKLNISVNKPKTFFISLDDYIHKNRLIIPYYCDDRVIWYQTRKLLDDDTPKYLSKVNSERSLYNMDKIDDDLEYIFIFEGAIDSMFVKNGTCVSGITESGDFMLTDLQSEQFRRFPFHKRVWMLDSPYLDKAARIKTTNLFNSGELVFQWPQYIGENFKDFNDMVLKTSKNEIPYKWILKNIMKEEPKFFKLNLDSLKDFVNSKFG